MKNIVWDYIRSSILEDPLQMETAGFSEILASVYKITKFPTMVDHILDMWTFTTIANYHMKQ
jgi:hypothetical protein